jgi:hypothetical protein
VLRSQRGLQRFVQLFYEPILSFYNATLVGHRCFLGFNNCVQLRELLLFVIATSSLGHTISGTAVGASAALLQMSRRIVR